MKGGIFTYVKDWFRKSLVMFRHKFCNFFFFLKKHKSLQEWLYFYFCTHKSNVWCLLRENIFLIMLQSILQCICSVILSNWSLWAFLECHAQNPGVGSPKLSLDESGLVFPAATVHSEVAEKGCLGVLKKRGSTHSHHSSFTFRKPCSLPLFSISHSSLSCSLWSFIITPLFIKVSLQL